MTPPLEWLFSLETFGIKFGLTNITALLDALGRPDRAFTSIHVGGTNGKGSVTAMVDAALRAAGHRCARYTSPHLVAINERFVIDGREIDDAALESAAGEIRRLVEQLVNAGRLDAPPTFFEATTAIAFELFRRAGVKVAVCEVGLGGRLDATNVLQPLVCAITTIGRDHEQYLGDTLEAIAAEKAGIIKPDTPVVAGRLPEEAMRTVRAAAHPRGADFIEAWEGVTVDEAIGSTGGTIQVRTPQRRYPAIRMALAGAHQVDNAVVALRVLESVDARGLAAPADAVVQGLQQVRWPGRLELRTMADGREALLDAAHNVDGAEALARHLRRIGLEQSPVVFAAMRDKDAAGMLRALAPVSSALVMTRASNPRSTEPDDLAAAARRVAPGVPVMVEPSISQALAAAWRLSPRIVIAGSIFLLGDAMSELGGS